MLRVKTTPSQLRTTKDYFFKCIQKATMSLAALKLIKLFQRQAVCQDSKWKRLIIGEIFQNVFAKHCCLNHVNVTF